MAAFFIADRIDIEPENVQNLICWGINSSIQHVDITHGWIEPDNQAVCARIGNDNWVMVELTGAIRNCRMDIRTKPTRTTYINNVATSLCNHIWDGYSGTPADQWVSVGIFSTGAYNVPQNAFASFPATCQPWRRVEHRWRSPHCGLLVYECGPSKRTLCLIS
ncbi:malate dehydrogenase, cytoplasmic-like [Syzygium oleosum]|uniref:malate dehydrogenase, cytoplasmic-like n=1 Tax=Syzygium oleosum TaxID=219896 RepID=UPI0024B973A4|nr:malate dehydrogenase, cytoplasmic-like [Syzygium oleosum]